MERKVIAVVDDLFFASKVRGAAQQAGVQVTFLKSIAAVVERVRDDAPALIIADLNAQCCDPIELAAALKAEEGCARVPLLGFFSHVQTELQQRASAAGFDQVLPRSAFTNKLSEILRGRENNQPTG